MSVNQQLLDAVKARGAKKTPFARGITTADRYVSTLKEMIGIDNCYKFAATRSKSFIDCLDQSKSQLVYSNDDMIVDTRETASEIELPKNTLMVFRHVLTTPRKDRDGDILRTTGATPDPNMLLLWQHVHNLPIGKALYVAEHTDKALTMVSAIVDINELAHDAMVMVDNDMARFSHGFRALEFDELKPEGDEKQSTGFDITKFEIMEESIVSVPSNVDATVQERTVDLASNGKLTSQLMKEYAKTIRASMPVTVATSFNEKDDTDAKQVNETIDDATTAIESVAGGTATVITPEETASENGERESTGKDAVETETKTTVEQEDDVKSGRAISAVNLKKLKSVIADLKELNQDETLTRGSTALTERCLVTLNSVIESVDDNEPSKDVPLEHALELIYSKASTEQLATAQVIIGALLKTTDPLAEQYRQLVN